MKICISCGTIHERDNMRPCCQELKLMPIRHIWEQWLLLEQRNKVLTSESAAKRQPVSAHCPNCHATFEVMP